MRSRIVIGTLFGAIGGFLGFAIQEVLIKHDAVLDMTQGDLIRLGAYVGIMIGIALGAVEGVVVGSQRVLARGIALGAGIGLIGGVFGAYFGGVLYAMLTQGGSRELQRGGGFLNFIQLVIARALGWTFFGAFPGMAAGAATLSRKRTLHGLAGGVLGGFVGGLLFDPIATALAPLMAPAAAASGSREFEGGALSRGIGFTLIGLLSGLFIGLVEELLKQAWVRVLAGKNEGKDYIISKPMTVLGRDERSDVPIFGDPSLAPQHAAIKMENNRHTLLDGGTSIGSIVNGQRVTQPLLLKDGDMIQLGQVRLLFNEKSTAAKIHHPQKDKLRAAGVQSPNGMAMPSHLCGFCGAQKDAQGNCLCSVPGTAVVGGPPNTTAFGTGPLTGSPGFSPNFGDPGLSGMPSAYGEQYAPQTQYGGAAVYGTIGTQLSALDGPYAGTSFAVGGPMCSVGRSPENGVPLVNDSTVSRHHAHLSEENGHHVVYDDGSSNGTFVNNVRVQIQVLAPGDVVQFGSSKFRYD